MGRKKIKLNPGQCCCGPIAPETCASLDELFAQLKAADPTISDEQLTAYVYDQIITRGYADFLDAVDSWHCGGTAATNGTMKVIYDNVKDIKYQDSPYNDPLKWWIGGGPDLVLNNDINWKQAHEKTFATTYDDDKKIVLPHGTEEITDKNAPTKKYPAVVATWQKCGTPNPGHWTAKTGQVCPYTGLIFSNPRLTRPMSTYFEYGGYYLSANEFRCDLSCLFRKDVAYDQLALLNSPTIGTVETVWDYVRAVGLGDLANGFANALYPTCEFLWGDDDYPLEDDDGNQLYDLIYDWEHYYAFPNEAKNLIEEFHGGLLINYTGWSNYIGVTQRATNSIDTFFDHQQGSVHLVYDGNEELLAAPFPLQAVFSSRLYKTVREANPDQVGPYAPITGFETLSEAQAICDQTDAEGLQKLQEMCAWSPEQQLYANGDCGHIALQGQAFFRNPNVEENECVGGE